MKVEFTYRNVSYRGAGLADVDPNALSVDESRIRRDLGCGQCHAHEQHIQSHKFAPLSEADPSEATLDLFSLWQNRLLRVYCGAANQSEDRGWQAYCNINKKSSTINIPE